MQYKLGKHPPKHNAKTLMFSRYLKATAPPVPPTKAFWEYKIPEATWGMMANDTVVDCTCAAIAHMLMNWTAHTGKIVVPTVDQVLAAYSAITGYDPSQTQSDGSNPTDQGAAITDVLAYWQSTGLAGHKIDGWVQIDPANLQAVQQAVYLLGGLDIGIQLPNSAVDQNSAGQAWEVIPDDGGIAGGHSIVNFGYGRGGTTAITWGMRQPMSWAWFQKYCDEAYAVVSLDWLDASGTAPSHLNVAQLRADLQALKA